MYVETFLKIYLFIIFCGEADFELTMPMKKKKLKNGGESSGIGNEVDLVENANIIDDNFLYSFPTKKVTCNTDIVATPCDASSSTSSSSHAVVLYQPELNTPLKRFRVPSRTFEFAGRQLTIQQKWDDHGVAAVVWDSVCYFYFLSKFCKLNWIHRTINFIYVKK